MLFFATLVACSMLFFSCNNKTADVNLYPIAGKTYQATEAQGTILVSFRTNFKTSFTIKPNVGSITTNDSFVWQMSLDTILGTEQSRKIFINFADGTVYAPTGKDVSGLRAYEGLYDGQKCVLYPTYPAEDKEGALTYLPL